MARNTKKKNEPIEIAYFEFEIMDMVNNTVLHTDDFNMYWNLGRMEHPYDCVIRGKLLGVKEDDTVYYNDYNHVILFDDDITRLMRAIRKKAIYDFVDKHCDNLDDWIRKNAEDEDNAPLNSGTDYDILLNTAAREFGFEDFNTINGSMENMIFAYAFCLNDRSWTQSEEGQIYNRPLSHFHAMDFKNAIARVKIYLHAFHRENEYMDTIVSTPEERIALALEKIANKLNTNETKE